MFILVKIFTNVNSKLIYWGMLRKTAEIIGAWITANAYAI